MSTYVISPFLYLSNLTLAEIGDLRHGGTYHHPSRPAGEGEEGALRTTPDYLQADRPHRACVPQRRTTAFGGGLCDAAKDGQRNLRRHPTGSSASFTGSAPRGSRNQGSPKPYAWRLPHTQGDHRCEEGRSVCQEERGGGEKGPRGKGEKEKGGAQAEGGREDQGGEGRRGQTTTGEGRGQARSRYVDFLFLLAHIFALTEIITERLAEEERLRAEEEAALAAAAELKRKEEAEAAARREARERERQETLEKARLQQQREEEAEARRQARAAEKVAGARKPLAAPTAVPAGIRASSGKEDSAVWRRSTTVNTSTAAPPPPVRSESPAPKYRPGALGGAGGGGWRQREEASKAAGGGRPAAAIPPRVTASPRPSSPAPLKEEPKKDADGFQTVGAPTRGVWRPTRGGRV